MCTGASLTYSLSIKQEDLTQPREEWGCWTQGTLLLDLEVLVSCSCHLASSLAAATTALLSLDEDKTGMQNSLGLGATDVKCMAGAGGAYQGGRCASRRLKQSTFTTKKASYTSEYPSESTNLAALRPGARNFLLAVLLYYKVIVFTARGDGWLDKVLAMVDPHKELLVQRSEFLATGAASDVAPQSSKQALQRPVLHKVSDAGHAQAKQYPGPPDVVRALRRAFKLLALGPASLPDIIITTTPRSVFGSLSSQVIEVTPYDTRMEQFDDVLDRLVAVLVRHAAACADATSSAPVPIQTLLQQLSFGQEPLDCSFLMRALQNKRMMCSRHVQGAPAKPVSAQNQCRGGGTSGASLPVIAEGGEGQVQVHAPGPSRCRVQHRRSRSALPSIAEVDCEAECRSVSEQVVSVQGGEAVGTHPHPAEKGPNHVQARDGGSKGGGGACSGAVSSSLLTLRSFSIPRRASIRLSARRWLSSPFPGLTGGGSSGLTGGGSSGIIEEAVGLSEGAGVGDGSNGNDDRSTAGTELGGKPKSRQARPSLSLACTSMGIVSAWGAAVHHRVRQVLRPRGGGGDDGGGRDRVPPLPSSPPSPSLSSTPSTPSSMMSAAAMQARQSGCSPNPSTPPPEVPVVASLPSQGILSPRDESRAFRIPTHNAYTTSVAAVTKPHAAALMPMPGDASAGSSRSSGNSAESPRKPRAIWYDASVTGRCTAAALEPQGFATGAVTDADTATAAPASSTISDVGSCSPRQPSPACSVQGRLQPKPPTALQCPCCTGRLDESGSAAHHDLRLTSEALGLASQLREVLDRIAAAPTAQRVAGQVHLVTAPLLRRASTAARAVSYRPLQRALQEVVRRQADPHRPSARDVTAQLLREISVVQRHAAMTETCKACCVAVAEAMTTEGAPNPSNMPNGLKAGEVAGSAVRIQEATISPLGGTAPEERNVDVAVCIGRDR